MSDTALSQAIKEAYASAPVDDFYLYTIEINHPAFVDGSGNPTAIRVVADEVDLVATLEASAPLNGGQQVTFTAFAFDVKPPEVSDIANPVMTLVMDNVSTEIENNIALATASGVKAEVTFRIYLSSDLSGPQNYPTTTMTVFDIVADDFTVTCTCGYSDPANKLFPGELYTLQRFPSLSR